MPYDNTIVLYRKQVVIIMSMSILIQNSYVLCKFFKKFFGYNKTNLRFKFSYAKSVLDKFAVMGIFFCSFHNYFISLS